MKKLLFVQSKAPHGTIAGQEGLDALLAGSAFTTCELLLLDDGVFQVVGNQATDGLGVKDYSVSYGALADYGVESIYVSASHMARRRLADEDLVVPVTQLDDEGVRQLLASADVILTY